MHFFDPNLTLFLCSFLLFLQWIYFVVRYLHNQTMRLRDYIRPKIDWNRVFFSFLYGFYHCFYVTFYFTNPDGFVLNFKPVPFVILLIIGTLLIPIQTSTEEYIF
jgi:hypothetical protein